MAGRKGSSGMTSSSTSSGGSGNNSMEVRNKAKSLATSTSDYTMNYLETTSGSTWKVDGSPKGGRSVRGAAGIEVKPEYQGDGFVVSKWKQNGDQLPKTRFDTIVDAMNSAKRYLKSGWKRTK